jgi:DNA-binding transcriptional MerR regulator
MTMPDIPDKLYYSISEVKDITGIEPYVLRFWETEFPSLRPRKNKKGHRTYRKKDIELILKIKALLYDEKYTIPGAREALAEKRAAPAAPAPPPVPATPRVAAKDDTGLLDHIHRELTDLAALLNEHKTEDIFAD